jgi:hypothetical protein
VLSARSGWRRLRPDIRVHRRIGADATVQWGRYRYQTTWVVHGLARRVGGTVEPPLPGSFQIEIGQDLTASIHVCAHEEPHYILDQEPLDLRRYLTAAAATGPGLVPRLPWEIHVGRVDQVGRFDIVPVFQGLGGRAGSPMPHRFHEVEPVGGEVGGVISPALPEGTGPRFEFFGVTATGAPVPLGSLPVPPSYGSPRYYATLDEFARLRVHPGYPSYLPARSLDEVFRIPGSVLREPMDPWHPDPDGDLDPFSGEH